MDLLSLKSHWKIFLVFTGLLIIGITLYYSNYLGAQLKAREEQNKEYYIAAMRMIALNEDLGQDLTLTTQITDGFSLPIIHKMENGDMEGNNWGEKNDTNQVFLQKKINQFLADDLEPIPNKYSGGQLYVFNSKLVRLIQLYPLVQFLLVSLFIALSYYLFNIARNAEQNRVWAGMAKETAHQLGTPISAIMAWVEHLKEANKQRPDQLEILDELNKDINRLDLIADRFSKIGSAPNLELTNLYDQLDEIKVYMQRRAPRKVEFDFDHSIEPLYVSVNQHLFSWVLENLIRNSLDAMDSQGRITARVTTDDHEATIDLSDTGKGIPHNMFKTVFQPGYSTKKRGWGLGLSLAKRIIENYHNGKIFVKSSVIDEGTTIGIKLPLA